MKFCRHYLGYFGSERKTIGAVANCIDLLHQLAAGSWGITDVSKRSRVMLRKAQWAR
jgi:hypothetical protein